MRLCSPGSLAVTVVLLPELDGWLSAPWALGARPGAVLVSRGRCTLCDVLPFLLELLVWVLREVDLLGCLGSAESWEGLRAWIEPRRVAKSVLISATVALIESMVGS